MQTEFDYLITPDGLVYNFDDRSSPLNDGRFLLTFEGQGMPDLHYITQRGPFQHGVTVLDYRLDPRTITYLHFRSACNRQGYWDARADLINHCRPNRQVPNTPFKPAQLRKVFPDGTMRDIDVYIQSGPYGVPRTLDRWRETRFTETLKWLAADPTFYDPAATILTLDISICDDLIFPFEFPFEFCDSTLAAEDTITYGGTWLANPIIYFTGPLRFASVFNKTTLERIAFTRDIPAGTTITVDTRYGVKTVTDDSGQSWRGALTSDSDLATFHLAPDPEAAGGVNVIAAGGFGGIPGLTSIKVQYNTRYIGI